MCPLPVSASYLTSKGFTLLAPAQMYPPLLPEPSEWLKVQAWVGEGVWEKHLLPDLTI